MLTQQQKSAVIKGVDKHLAIYAVAGSGKTSVIVERIKYLYQSGHTNQLVITFTKKAATNVRKRLGKSFDSIVIGTFHSFCYSMLKTYVPDYTKNEIIDDQDFRITIWISKLIADLGVACDVNDIQSLIHKYDTGGKHYTELSPLMDNGLCNIVINVKKLMVKERKRTFPDLLLDFLFLLKTNQTALTEIQNKFPVVMVDEFQDTDRTQMMILQKLSQKCHLSVVGDVSQAIYSSFRGCSPEFLLNTEQYFGPTDTINMSRNFRSGGKILTAANSVIVNNKIRSNVTIDVLDDLGDINVIRSGDRASEALSVCDKIKSMGDPWDRFAVLFRTNAQSAFIESVLAREDIPFDSGDSKGFFGMLEIRPFIEYLKIIMDPSNINSLKFIWNKPNRFLKTDLINAAAEKEKSADSITILNTVRKSKLNIRQVRAVDTLSHMLVRLIEQSKERPGKVLRNIFSESRYDFWLKDIAKMSHYKQYQDMSENVRALFGVADQFVSIKQFLANVKRIQQNNKKTKDENTNKVSLLTIHRSKGLEFQHVFLIGAEEGLLPHKNSTDLEEERRLAYVAFTRPKTHLDIYYVGEPSRFISEANLEIPNEI